MAFKQVESELALFAETVIAEARKNLRRKKKVTTGELLKSLTYAIDTSQKDTTILNFVMKDYGRFVDRGVQGKDPYALPAPGKNKKGDELQGAKWYGKNRAPNSPYKFGSMSSRGLRGAINKWTIQKGIPGIRDKKGRFVPRKSMQFMMTRSIYLAGLEATMFFTDPYNKNLVRFINKFLDAFIFDVDVALRQQKKGVNYNK